MLKHLVVTLLVCCLLRAQENSLSVSPEPAVSIFNPQPDYSDYTNLYSQMLANPDSFNTTTFPYTANLLQSMICLYQRHLTGNGDGKQCQFTPSCSRYSYMAISGLRTVKGLVYTLDRLWRCNNSASGRYEFYGNYFLDPPVTLKPIDISIEDSQNGNINDTTYNLWLLQHREWDSAYREFLSEEFQHPSEKNRLRLAQIALNRGFHQKTINWLEGDSSTAGSFTRAIAFYRSNMFTQTMMEIENHVTDSVILDYKTAALWLIAYFNVQQNTQPQFYYRSIVVVRHYGGKEFLSRELEKINPSSVSPIVSMSLSAAIPGLGQASNGFIEDGIYALVMVGGFTYLTVHNLVSKRYGEAIAFGLGFSLTYSANLFAAYHAPERRYAINVGKILQVLLRVYDPTAPVIVK